MVRATVALSSPFELLLPPTSQTVLFSFHFTQLFSSFLQSLPLLPIKSLKRQRWRSPLNGSQQLHTLTHWQRLPPGYVVRTFSNIRRLRKDANDVLTTLEANGGQGNQFLVLRGLTKAAIERLDNDRRGLSLGVSHLFQWDGCVGIMKIIPGFAHHVTTTHVFEVVVEQLLAMGIPRDDRVWGGNTTYKPQARTGKQADQIFWPGTRSPKRGRLPGWPTLVIETGLSESHPKLEADAKWWFANSSGDVRIVLLILLNTTYARFEKWQLVPPNAPRPVTRVYLDQLNPERTHEVTVTATTVDSAPMTLPFAALYERTPGPNEGDVVITSQMFRYIVDWVL